MKRHTYDGGGTKHWVETGQAGCKLRHQMGNERRWSLLAGAEEFGALLALVIILLKEHFTHDGPELSQIQIVFLLFFSHRYRSGQPRHKDGLREMLVPAYSSRRRSLAALLLAVAEATTGGYRGAGEAAASEEGAAEASLCTNCPRRVPGSRLQALRTAILPGQNGTGKSLIRHCRTSRLPTGAHVTHSYRSLPLSGNWKHGGGMLLRMRGIACPPHVFFELQRGKERNRTPAALITPSHFMAQNMETVGLQHSEERLPLTVACFLSKMVQLQLLICDPICVRKMLLVCFERVNELNRLGRPNLWVMMNASVERL
ncbi:uncharacterized protein PHA67_006685 [Liasis olivaceus]